MQKYDEGVRFLIGKYSGSDKVNIWQGKYPGTSKNTWQENSEGKN